MPSKENLGRAFRIVRRAARMSQDDFTAVSSRTFVSSIERGLKSPTIDKLTRLADAMNTDAAVIVMVASALEAKSEKRLLEKLLSEATHILDARGSSG